MDIESKKFIQRIEEMLDYLGRMAAGDLNEQIPLSEARDYLDALAFGINLLADEIKFKQDQDEAQKQELLNAQKHLQETLEKLRKTQEKLVHTTKLAALGEISAGMAHEINNPLTVISGIMEKIEISVEDKELDHSVLKEEISVVFQQIHRISEIIHQVKGFAEVSEAEFERIDLSELARRICDLYSNQFAINDIQFTFFTSGSLHVRGQENRLEQVFINLLNNAKDAVTLIDNQEKQRKVFVNVVEGKSGAEINFSDNGFGISSANQAKIFDPFYTTKKAGEGMGLGLSISQEIVQSHKGTITVSSDGEKGSTITVSLPLEGD